MRELKGITALALAGLLISGCALTPMQAEIDPEPEIHAEDVGHNQQVALRVTDERPDTVLGHRGSGLGKGAEITTEQDIAAMFKDEIAMGLEKKEFVIAPYDQDALCTLDIEIRLLEYSTSTGFWTGGVHMKAAMKVEASKNSRAYEEIYRIDDEYRVAFVPGASENEQIINDTATKIIEQLFDDDELLTFLAR